MTYYFTILSLNWGRSSSSLNCETRIIVVAARVGLIRVFFLFQQKNIYLFSTATCCKPYKPYMWASRHLTTPSLHTLIARSTEYISPSSVAKAVSITPRTAPASVQSIRACRLGRKGDDAWGQTHASSRVPMLSCGNQKTGHKRCLNSFSHMPWAEDLVSIQTCSMGLGPRRWKH